MGGDGMGVDLYDLYLYSYVSLFSEYIAILQFAEDHQLLMVFAL